MAPYDVQAIEAHWRKRWETERVGLVDLAAVDPTEVFINQVEFPYPSAEGLHVGHVFRYAGVDTYGRYWRMTGRQVFQPIGFDSFGINTENYALKVGENPATLTARTTERFRRQLSRTGMAWDWERSVTTSDPRYYRWTQWILTRFFEAGLLYQAEAPVIWCPSCLTVLAREQTEDDGTVCERCDTRVSERVMTQWFLRITAYADRLLDGLDRLDWPDWAKRLQRQWIGRSEASEGANGSQAVTYRLHDWLISRQRYWGPPIPIVHCPDCGPVAVPDHDLPVQLPAIADFRPSGTGESPLAGIADWVDTPCPHCGNPAHRETDVSDTFVDSAWYFLRYPSTEFEDRAWDQQRTERMLPLDFYAGGPEHVQRHHLYARFFTMALHDLGMVPFEEPFPRIRIGGMIVKDGSKMSKSRGNVVSPDEYIDSVGADALRCGLLFSAPWEHGGDFTDAAIAGIERFFAKAWRTITGPDQELCDDRGIAQAIHDVAAAIERLAFNVGLARLMELVAKVGSPGSKRVFVRLLAPFAPHLAEELWHRLGEPFSVHTQPWPGYDESLLDDDDVEITVQIDGKVRGRITVPQDASEAEATAIARREVATVAADEYPRVVYVPGRAINFVT
jgi:leucyl-tRNA synthetase